ncbi:FHA domain-containing protein [Phycicoccus sp. Soil803]|uniref:FHA domain-containing protein n=1 Tax=Phycicoccus sp. Soil803 TaxID=1736415 RepID=UPI00070CACA8|nr:FHA domain-containing protein [Phycicoccus sp. Soil803]KRF23882.1 hypothetical protein ASG95_04270 [Phycicoccus sp. Soil803]
MSTLVVTTPAGRTVHEPGTSVSIGRDHDCTIRLDSPVVSRHHGTFESVDGAWTFRDESSSLGSWVEGQRVRAYPLSTADVIVLGQGEKAVPIRVETQTLAQRPGGPLVADPALDAETLTTGDELLLECAGQSCRLAAGQTAVVGRADDATIVSHNPRVSRHHLEVRHTGTEWEVADTGSTGGVFAQGRRVTRIAVSGTVEVMLGDPDVGERLVVSSQSPPARARRGDLLTRLGALVPGQRRTVAAVVAGALVVVGVGGWGLARAVSGPSEPDLDRLAQATVRVVTESGSGSGTVVDAARGLILTNAHVAAPDAPGQGVVQGVLGQALTPSPTSITIAVSSGRDQPATERYRAEVAAADGYLDLAVLRITVDDKGSALPEGALDDLVDVELARSADVRSADPVWVVGFPGLAQSDAATFTRGVVSGTVHDPRLKDAVSLFNSDARLNPGNSGGLAADADGRIIAVPTLNKHTRDDSLLAGLVPVDLARPLIDAAARGRAYTSPWVVGETEGAVTRLSLGRPGSSPGVTAGCAESGARSTSRRLGVLVTYQGLADLPHQDWLVTVSRKSDPLQRLGRVSSARQWPLKLPTEGCFTATIDIGEPLSPGTYVIEVGLGGNHTRIATLTYTLS